MQTLAQYLDGKHKGEFASAINVSPSQLSQYLSGYRRPSFKKMLEIQAVTGGAVPLSAWADHAEAAK